MSKYYIGKLLANQLSKHLVKLVKIHETYFGLKTKMDILAPFRSAKTKSIVNACFCIVRFVLYKVGKKSVLNLRKDALKDTIVKLQSYENIFARRGSKPLLELTGRFSNTALSGRTTSREINLRPLSLKRTTLKVTKNIVGNT